MALGTKLPRGEGMPLGTAARRYRWQVRLHLASWVLLLLTLLISVALVLGPAIDDRKIHADPGRALATVVATSRGRALVEYQDEQGLFQRPARGVHYPGGLVTGQRVWVSYSRQDPELVTVAGRRWTLALRPAGSVAGTALLVFGAVQLGLRRLK